MTATHSVDGELVQCGERLFYPGNRIVKASPLPRLSGSVRRRAQGIRNRIHATVTMRAPQVLVKVTGGGRGMAAIAAHFRYISKSGQLTIEDDRRVDHEGSRREALTAWAHVVVALEHSDDPWDQSLAKDARRFVSESAYFKEAVKRRQRELVDFVTSVLLA